MDGKAQHSWTEIRKTNQTQGDMERESIQYAEFESGGQCLWLRGFGTRESPKCEIRPVSWVRFFAAAALGRHHLWDWDITVAGINE
jgi:hypothetical protein